MYWCFLSEVGEMVVSARVLVSLCSGVVSFRKCVSLIGVVFKNLVGSRGFGVGQQGCGFAGIEPGERTGRTETANER